MTLSIDYTFGANLAVGHSKTRVCRIRFIDPTFRMWHSKGLGEAEDLEQLLTLSQ